MVQSACMFRIHPSQELGRAERRVVHQKIKLTGVREDGYKTRTQAGVAMAKIIKLAELDGTDVYVTEYFLMGF